MKRFFRMTLCLLVFGLLPVVAGAATMIDDPEKFVKGIYENLAKKPDFVPPDDFYTPRLNELFALERKEAGGEVGRIDFDFWTNAQDWSLSDVKVTQAPVEGASDRLVVLARFMNGDRKEEIHFYFERSTAGWLLDDARSVGGEQWTLSLILKYGWDPAP